jgi:quercetin dioxygenase-like cupin family protein
MLRPFITRFGILKTGCLNVSQEEPMIEKIYQYTRTEEKAMVRIVDDERVNINHITVPPGEAVPTHVSNSYVHQIVLRGTLSLSLEDQEFHHHPAGSIVAVPFDKKMIIQNQGDETLEFFVVKAPNPRSMPATKPL